jgi:uncharacterized protein involved in outer membrane biogenesis
MRGIRYLIIAIVAIATMVVVAVVFVFTADLGQFERQVEDFVSKKMGRSFRIDGMLSLQIGKSIDLVANEVHLGNAEWAVADDLISVESIVVSIPLASVFDGPLIVRNLEVIGFEMNFEKDPETGASSFDFENMEVASEAPEVTAASDGPIPVVFENVLIENFVVVYGEGWLEESRTLLIDSASVDGDPGELLNIAVTGSIDEVLPLKVKGTVGPLEALVSGENLSWELALALGQFEANSRGAFLDAFNMVGPDVELQVTGPSAEIFLERLGLPVFASGVIDLRGTAAKDAEGVNTILKGEFGDLTIDVSLQAESLQTLESGRLNVDVAGPDIRVISTIAGIGDLAREPFSVNTVASAKDGIVDISALTAKIGEDELRATVRIDSADNFRIISADLSLSAPSAEAFLGRFHLPVVAKGSIDLHGTVTEGTDGADAKLNGVFGDLAIDTNVQAESLRDLQAGQLSVDLSGPDISIISTIADVGDLAAEPFSIKALASVQGGIVDVSSLAASFGKDELRATAKIDVSENFRGISVDMSLAGPDIDNTIKPWAVVGLGSLPYTVSGVFDFDGNSLSFKDLDIAIRNFSANINGTTGNLPGLDGLEVSIVASNKNAALMRQLLNEHAPQFTLPSKAMSLEGTVTRRGDQWGLRGFRLTSGAHGFTVDGALGNLSGISGIDIVVSAKGPDLREFRAESVLPEALPYDVSGAVQVSTDQISFSDVVALIGKSSASVQGSLPISLTLSEADATVQLNVPDLGKIGKLTGNEWLKGGPFEFSGHLKQEGQQYRVENMSIKLGESDLRGDFGIQVEPKLKIVGVLESDSLNLAPYLPELEEAAVEAPPDPAETATGKSPLLIPDVPLPVDLLGFADLELDFKIDDFQTRRRRLGNINLHVHMDENNLQVRTGDVALPDGGHISLDFGAARNANGANIGVRFVGTEFTLREHRDADGNPMQRPLLNVELELAGSGSTTRDIAASANGYARSQWSEGKIENSFTAVILRDVFAQVVSVLNPLAKEEKYSTLECAIVDVSVVEGLVTTNVVAGRTPRMSVASVGTLNLATEQIDFSFRTRQREGLGISLAGAVNPYFKVAGTLGQPALHIDTKRGFFAGAVAALTVGVSILAQGVFDRYLAADNLCEAVAEGLDAGEIGDQTSKDELALDNLLPFLGKK